MKKVLLAATVACGLSMAAEADEATVKVEVSTEAPKAEAPAEAVKPAPVEVELTGKVVSETRKTEGGEEKTVYALEIADGEKVPLPARKNALPKDVDLSTFVGKTVTLKGEVVERTHEGKTVKHVKRVSSIVEAAQQ